MKELVFPTELVDTNFTKELEDFFYKAAKYAKLDKIYEITPTNLIFTIITDDKSNLLMTTLETMKVDLNIFYEMLKENRNHTLNKTPSNSEIHISKELTELITKTNKVTKQTKKEYGIIELFLSMLKYKNTLTPILTENAIEYFVFKQTYEEVLEFYNVETEDNIVFEHANQPQKKTGQNVLTLIESFTTNLNSEYEKGNIQKCIGREFEIETLERVLNRKNKKNAILIGKAGVGKTQIVEGLVQKIVEKTVTPSLQNAVVLALNVNDLEAGTVWRGQLEDRIKNLLTFLDQHENVILFIDEIHSIMGVGRAANADLSNALKPYLSKGKIKIIGATTTEEYKLYIENNRALTRRFFIQHIEELSAKDTLEILTKIKNTYEDLHNVTYSNEILNLIVDFCNAYLKNKSFPDKAIEIMDDLGAGIKAKQTPNKKLISLNKKLKDVKITKDYILQNKKYEDSERILWIESGLKEQLETELKKNESQIKTKITKNNFINYLNQAYKISNFVGNNYEEKLDFVESAIKKELFQQDHVIESVINQIRTKKLFNDYDSPLTLMFLGESGVGKTFCAELLAKHLFDNKIKILHGELFKERHAVSNILGSPKGYVDSDKGSDLFEYIKYNPESIVLIDEIEKAHPDFYDILLTFLDKGILTDKDGEIIDARRCIIILTSNIGTKNISEFPPIGFKTPSQNDNNLLLESAMKKKFSPEFINRMDEICYFNSINNFELILMQQFNKIKELMAAKNIEVELSEETKTNILKTCKEKNGAVRLLNRAIYKEIKQKIAARYRMEKALRV